MTGLLAGKSTLVTGGGAGIGRATAIAFAREGARVAVADLDLASAADTARAIGEAGGESLPIRCDVTVPDEVAAMVERTVAHFGSLDCAFNNAGLGTAQVDGYAATHQWTEANFDRIVAVNLKGVWLCMREELAVMLAAGRGVIVNAGSTGSLVGFRKVAPYSAAKHGVIGLTKSAALDYAAAGIRINAVCPGLTETAMTEQARNAAGAAAGANVPCGRPARPAEIAEAVVWLASDRASYVTGTAFSVDGGYVAM